jgi:hypothetical protein
VHVHGGRVVPCHIVSSIYALQIVRIAAQVLAGIKPTVFILVSESSYLASGLGKLLLQ